MAVQYSVDVRNAMLDAIETATGATAKLMMYDGAMPANCAAAAAGTLLLTMTLPADWMANAAAGVKALSGTWTTTCSVSGTATYYRIYDNSETVCHEQGTVGTAATDIVLDNNVMVATQTVNIISKSITAGNA
jgi:hypothetical protein